MHPAKSFAWNDVPAMRDFVRRTGFAHLFVATAAGPIVAHAPLLVSADGAIRFHIARSNRIAAHLDGTALLASVAASDFYVSPDWYAVKDSVPTWNYLAVEIEGVVRALADEELVAQLDDLSAEHEARLAPKIPWTRAKMPAGRFEAMLGGIRGFAIDAPVWRGTAKLGQNKSAADRAGVVAAIAPGRPDLAALVAGARS